MAAKDSTWRKMIRLYRRHTAGSVASLAGQYVADHPKDGFAWLYYGAALGQMSRYSEAMRAMGRAKALFPAAKLHLVYYNFGQLHERKGAFRQAERWYRRAIDNHPSDAGYPIALGRLLLRAGRCREAEALLRRATRCKEDCHEEAFLFLGLSLVALGKNKQARDCFAMALKIDPKYKEARKELLDMETVLDLQRTA